VQPHWLTGGRFWYCEETGGQAAIRLFDAVRDTLAPAFDQAKHAAALSSNVTLAPRLQGHLLLVHGDVDENVDPAETMRLVEGVIKANRDFNMLLVPNRFHSEGGNPYLIHRRWDYFVRYLLGVTPPHDFAFPFA